MVEFLNNIWINAVLGALGPLAGLFLWREHVRAALREGRDG